MRLRLSLESRGAEPQLVATLTWPAHLDAEARTFIRDNLLNERTGSTRATNELLARGRVTAGERARFLADKTFFPPEPPQQLAAEIDLEDLVAEFSVALKAFRAAAPTAELVLDWAPVPLSPASPDADK